MPAQLTLLLKSLPQLLLGAWATIELACLAILLGMVGGTLIGIINCRKRCRTSAAFFLQSGVWVVRGTPLFVQVLIVYYALPEATGIPLTPFTAGVIALGINSTAYISEIVRGGIDAIPDGQWEASYVLGLSPIQTMLGIILPQALRIALPGLTNELTSLIKETSVLMVIGVPELTKASKDIVVRELDPMTIYLAAAALYLAMTSVVTIFTQHLQKKETI